MRPNITGLNQTGFGFWRDDAVSAGFVALAGFFADGGMAFEVLTGFSFRELGTYVSYRRRLLAAECSPRLYNERTPVSTGERSP